MKVNITHSAEIDVRSPKTSTYDILTLNYGENYIEQMKVTGTGVIPDGNQVMIVCDVEARFKTAIYDEFGSGELAHKAHALVSTNQLSFSDLEGLQYFYPEDLSLELVEHSSQLDNREIEKIEKELYYRFGKLKFNFVIDVKDEKKKNNCFSLIDK